MTPSGIDPATFWFVDIHCVSTKAVASLNSYDIGRTDAGDCEDNSFVGFLVLWSVAFLPTVHRNLQWWR
jgi:hypothetical protein